MTLTDHPRIRGEHVTTFSAIDSAPGSSPHTRGARRLDPEHHHRIGIIPAYAGSTRVDDVADDGRGDHPRIRGEHGGTGIAQGADNGSSPHTRGAPSWCPRLRAGRGIIPAYAGSTANTSKTRLGDPDHPRIRGEHERGPIGIPASEGSSPHTRGARSRGSTAWARRRIIPAYAGSTTRR